VPKWRITLRWRVVRAFFCALVSILICLSAKAQSSRPWPELQDKAGSYDVDNAGEMADLATLGFRLHIMKWFWKPEQPVWQGLVKAKAKYIDGVPWEYIRRGCGFPNKENRCNLNPETSDAIVAELRSYLTKTATNPNVVGYWILDDYPGADIRELLQRIHSLVQEQNHMSQIARPTVCGFGGALDLKSDVRPPEIRYANIRRALTNFSTKACDAVALYPYAVGPISTSREDVDWSMRRLLPYVRRELQSRGWDPLNQPLIGIPQAFYYDPVPRQTRPHVMPGSEDIARQMAAFCENGASSIIFYSWHDSHASWHEGHNTQMIRSGLVEGLKVCRTIWQRR
jgi:hypothetical protein